MDEQNNMKVYHTTYDGYYTMVRNGKYYAYEGLNMCPPKVKKWLKDNKPIELNAFFHEAISYGYIK